MAFFDIFKNRFGRSINNIFIYDLADVIGDNEIFTDVDVSHPDGQYEAYLRTPVVNTIIDRLARLATNCNYFVENPDGESIETAQSKHLFDILAKPNGTQGFSQFIENYIINLKVFGEAWLLPIRLEGSREIKGITLLSNNKLSIYADYGNYPFQINPTNNIKSIYYSTPDNGQVNLTPVKDEIVVVYEMPDILKPGRGVSKLPGLKDHVNKYLISTNAATDILRNHGALGLWVNQGADAVGQTNITPKDREEIETALAQKGITSGKGKDYVTGLNLRHEKRSLPISDLMLSDHIIDSIRTICDSLGYSADLLSTDKGTSITASGGREAEALRSVINGSIIPVMDKLSEGIDKMLLPENQTLKFYYDHLPVFQTAERETADANNVHVTYYNALLDKGIITTEEYKQILIDLEILKP